MVFAVVVRLPATTFSGDLTTIFLRDLNTTKVALSAWSWKFNGAIFGQSNISHTCRSLRHLLKASATVGTFRARLRLLAVCLPFCKVRKWMRFVTFWDVWLWHARCCWGAFHLVGIFGSSLPPIVGFEWHGLTNTCFREDPLCGTPRKH